MAGAPRWVTNEVASCGGGRVFFGHQPIIAWGRHICIYLSLIHFPLLFTYNNKVAWSNPNCALTSWVKDYGTLSLFVLIQCIFFCLNGKPLRPCKGDNRRNNNCYSSTHTQWDASMKLAFQNKNEITNTDQKKRKKEIHAWSIFILCYQK